MDEQQVLKEIQKALKQVLEDKGYDIGEIDPNSDLLGGDLDIDSLDLATLVRELEDVIGHDPFADGFIEFHTIAELAKLYAK